MQEKIWEYYQNESLSSFDGASGRLQYISKSIRVNNKVLNIGVGSGLLENICTNKGADVFSLDPDEKTISRLQENGVGDDKAKVGYSQDIPYPDDCFDVVVMSEVLEHLDENILDQTIKEVRRVLKPEGLFVGTVPSNENLAESIVICPDCGKVFHRWGHQQTFSMETLKAVLVKEFSIEVIKDKTFIAWQTRSILRKFMGLIRVILYKLKIYTRDGNLYFEVRNL